MTQDNTQVQELVNKFMVYFDFTTVHRGSNFIGRSGNVALESTATTEQLSSDTEGLQKFVAAFIYEQKPKWNILMITITGISIIH